MKVTVHMPLKTESRHQGTNHSARYLKVFIRGDEKSPILMVPRRFLRLEHVWKYVAHCSEIVGAKDL